MEKTIDVLMTRGEGGGGEGGGQDGWTVGGDMRDLTRVSLKEILTRLVSSRLVCLLESLSVCV